MRVPEQWPKPAVCSNRDSGEVSSNSAHGKAWLHKSFRVVRVLTFKARRRGGVVQNPPTISLYVKRLDAQCRSVARFRGASRHSQCI
jgi:hypothetical protein